jgi:hypothetical protein
MATVAEQRAGVTGPASSDAGPADDDLRNGREVSWLEPCIACSGTEGCSFAPPHKIRCYFLDNGLGHGGVAVGTCVGITAAIAASQSAAGSGGGER